MCNKSDALLDAGRLSHPSPTPMSNLMPTGSLPGICCPTVEIGELDCDTLNPDVEVIVFRACSPDGRGEGCIDMACTAGWAPFVRDSKRVLLARLLGGKGAEA